MTVLPTIPCIDVLELARVTAVPAFHPEHDTFTPFPVHGFLVHHPDGPIVVDTGIGVGSDRIDGLYPHEHRDLIEELHRCGVDERDVRLIVNSHLHFDHCGQNHALGCPIAVQRSELEAAAQPRYTIAEWAEVPPARSRTLDGDTVLAPGVQAMHTPGHTPGHQSLVITARDEVVVIAAQCIFRRSAWVDGPETTNLHDEDLRLEAGRSLDRLRSLRPSRVLLSHDVLIEHPTDG